jgi:hypothetical protein
VLTADRVEDARLVVMARGVVEQVLRGEVRVVNS